MGEVRLNRLEVEGEPVARVVIDRAAKLNALNSALIAKISDAFHQLAGDDAVRAVVLEGEGRAWVVGADINELAALDRGTAATFIAHLHTAMLSVRDLPVPVVAKIGGFALGGGMELAAACDLRIASTNARFGMPEVQVGLPSVIEASLLPRLMGFGRAGRLMLTGEVIDAPRAAAWGFVEDVVAPGELDDAVHNVLTEICRAAPNAVRAQKRLLRSWQGMTPDAAAAASVPTFAEAFHTDEPTERLARFARRDGD